MKVVVATTTGFHLRRLAVELRALGEDIKYFSYMPRFRLRSEGMESTWAKSEFVPLLPTSAFALMRGAPWQMRAVESMLTRTDNAVAKGIDACDVFIGLSSMAVKSAMRARQLNAKVVVERGSRHVLSQQQLITQAGGATLTRNYIERELASYRAADFITVLSKHAAQSFVDQGIPKAKLFINPLGVDLETFQPTARPNGYGNILFVGAWSHRKGTDLLVSALEQRPNWQVTHVGVFEASAAARDHPRVSHVGHKTHTQLAQMMASQHVLVLPSREDGFGMVLLEALAAGLPVIASEMTGGPDIQGTMRNPRWVEVVQPDDADDLMRGLDLMLDREASETPSVLRERFAPEDKSYFSWTAYGARYATFLRGLSESEVIDSGA